MRRAVAGSVAGASRCPAVWAVQRVAVVTAGIFASYYLLPDDWPGSGRTVLITAACLGGIALLLGGEVRAIVRTGHPRLRALEALALAIPAFLIVFATAYFLISRHTVAQVQFNAPLTRTDALYFTVAVFCSAGFGDIVPLSESARLVVTGQMAADVVLLGVAARLVIDAVGGGMHRE